MGDIAGCNIKSTARAPMRCKVGLGCGSHSMAGSLFEKIEGFTVLFILLIEELALQGFMVGPLSPCLACGGIRLGIPIAAHPQLLADVL